MAAAFLVDGHTEQRFIQRVCPRSPVQRLNLNGSSVSAEAIAKRAATQIRLWGGRCHPIVVLVDMETRALTHEEFSEQLGDFILAQGIHDDVRVCVAKRMIENWILGDADVLGWDAAPENVDELHGANVLRRVLGDYDKAGDGPELLVRARPSLISLRSPSFHHARSVLQGLGCAWLAR